jgi:hypothetical protein
LPSPQRRTLAIAEACLAEYAKLDGAPHLECKAEQRTLAAWQRAAELRRTIEPADYQAP